MIQPSGGGRYEDAANLTHGHSGPDISLHSARISEETRTADTATLYQALCASVANRIFEPLWTVFFELS